MMMSYEMMVALFDEMDGEVYDLLASENVARMDARWAGDADAEALHESRLVGMLAHYGVSLEGYEHYLGHDEEEDWSDPVWDD